MQGLLDKHGRENDKTPKGWKDGYHDLTPKSMKAAAASGSENGAAAAGEEAADAASSPDGEKKKKKKKKDKVGGRDGPSLISYVSMCVFCSVFASTSTSPCSPADS